jgi:hypothetical protein
MFVVGRDRIDRPQFVSFRYIASVRSSDNLLEKILHRQKDAKDKIKVLIFMNKCFALTRQLVDREIQQLKRTATTTNNKSSYSTVSFTLDELQHVQSKIDDLLIGIEQRLVTLRTWIPPTMPFLGFF